MLRKAMGDIDVKAGVLSILSRVEAAYAKKSENSQQPKPLLVAVSKTKPVEMIIDAYSVNQKHFGENYVQELEEKGFNEHILQKCPDIKWHFIGHLQTNKINKVLKVPNLYMIETVDSEKLANSLDSAWGKLNKPDKEPLRVLVQVNTSGEEGKNGIQPSDAVKLYSHIKDNLKNLNVNGIMTIGAFGHDYSTGPNPDFISLMKVHKELTVKLNIEPHQLQVSMGMSDDFEQAIEAGSTIVRVGSSIFGHRAKKI
ncbi:pyridoxal phosphate homeostasis protein [Condylostylus longicornis]|uniref:pyridoxal phosphate homeostasis protein n=1 Tax=Condylostylus longicornis TaxID=2530218 RepID=UPI00244DEA1C|nr:pyridoxal phosphate homeostasis protein [Condylostylus longicornis]